MLVLNFMVYNIKHISILYVLKCDRDMLPRNSLHALIIAIHAARTGTSPGGGILLFLSMGDGSLYFFEETKENLGHLYISGLMVLGLNFYK